MTPNIVIIIQARMEASRLPGKTLLDLCGQPLILWLLSRLVILPHRLVVALPDTPANAELAALCDRHSYTAHLIPGDPQDVLGRFAKTTLLYPEAAHIVRICSDTPLLDPAVISLLIHHHLSNAWHDYTGLAQAWGDGNDAECFRRETLLAAHKEALALYDREHVSPWVWHQPERFRLAHLPCPFDLSHMRTSVDTKDDLWLAEQLLTRCLDRHGFGFTWRDVWWEVERSEVFREMMTQRPMNSAYLAQVGSAKSWAEERYGTPD